MTEIQDEKLPQVTQYEGLELEVVNDPKDRSFRIESSSGAEADFDDGRVLGYREQEPVREDNVLSIENVESYGAPPGTVTKLIRFGIEEGRRRAFNRGRSSAFNPRIVSIYEKLVAEGLIKQRYYFTRFWDEERQVIPSIEELLASGNRCTAQEAIKFLQSFDADASGRVQDALVDCIVEF